jgi:hypothetical protein
MSKSKKKQKAQREAKRQPKESGRWAPMKKKLGR